MLHIDPVAHLMAEVGPFARVHHHVLATLAVVVLDADGLTDVFLRDAKFLFYAKLYWQSVCVPAGFALHLEALHRLEAAECVLDAACQDMMDAWVSVGRWRPFVEDERGTTLSLGHTQVEDIFIVPLLKHFLIDVAQVKLIAFSEFLAHILYDL